MDIETLAQHDRVLAARLIRPGHLLAIEKVELPAPAPGEHRVELAYAGVNPFDGYNAHGLVGADGPLPRTLGGEAAGHCGGQAVLVAGGASGLGLRLDGTWASAANVPADAMVPIPSGVDLRRAATIGVAGQTAWQCVRTLAGVGPADRVLVLGAAGGVGSMVVSLAGATGAHVWGQTSRADRAAALREAGADEVVVGGPDAIGGLRPTVAFDALGGPFTPALVEALADGGRLVILGTSAGAESRLDLQTLYRKGLTVFGYTSRHFSVAERSAALTAALRALGDGQLKVRIDDVLPLRAVNDALDRLRTRSVVGKLVLDLRRTHAGAP